MQFGDAIKPTGDDVGEKVQHLNVYIILTTIGLYKRVNNITLFK